MKLKKIHASFILFSILVIIHSCDSKSGKSGPSSSSAHSEVTSPSVSSKAMENGLSVYKSHCFACHQMTGLGIQKLYPPLTGNKTITGDKTYLIRILLNGMSGEIVVNGEKYNQVMIPHNFLTDEQIADVLTYIRNSFGNQASQVTTSEVKKIRRENQN